MVAAERGEGSALAPTPRERYYAVSAERRVTHPAVLAITRAAREQLFA